MAVLALDEVLELLVAGGVVGQALAAVDGQGNCLGAYDLAGGGDEGHQAGVAANLRDEGHGLVEHVLGVEGAEVGYHVGVHAAGHLGVLHQLVGAGEAEVSLDAVAGVEQGLFVAGLGGLDGAIELGVDVGGHGGIPLVEVVGPVVAVEVELAEGLAGVDQFLADLGDCLHVDVELDAELLAEDPDELDGGSGGTAAEPPDVGVDDVDALDDGCQHGCQAVAGCAVGVEVNGHAQSLFELGHQGVDAGRVDQACHVLEGDHLGADGLHLLGLVDEVLVGEDLLVGTLGVHGVADGGVGDASELVDEADGGLYVVDVVKGVEDTHDVKAVLDCLLVEAFEHGLGIGYVSEEVAAAAEGAQQ